MINRNRNRQLTDGCWFKLTIIEQMANIGSEVMRAISWKKKGDEKYSNIAFERALELLDLIIADPRYSHRLKEICRTRESLCDYFVGGNEYKSTDEQWEKYFYAFNFAARKDR
jgi:hypothetical protein